MFEHRLPDPQLPFALAVGQVEIYKPQEADVSAAIATTLWAETSFENIAHAKPTCFTSTACLSDGCNQAP